jgi:site-specific DNA recombinase
MHRTPSAIGYVRVSTVGQAQDGISLDAQRSQLMAWAARERLVIEVHADEGKSGKSRSRRPGLAAAITAAKKHRLPLVVWSMSRLSRSTRDSLDIAAELNARRAKLVSLSENIDTRTAAGELAFTMFAAINQHERKVRSEQTREGLRELRAQGKRISKDAPFGYEFTVDGRVVECHDEQWTLRAIRSLRYDDGLSFRAIEAALAKRGVEHFGRAGRPMRFASIAKILRREEAQARERAAMEAAA